MAESRAVVKYVRITPSKAQQVINLVRGRNVDEAINILAFSPKAAAKIINKVVNSASANAEKNHGMRRDILYISEAFANQGPTLKRFRPRAQGRASKIRKRTSHITIIVREREPKGA